MQTLVLWSGATMVTLLFMAALIQVVKTPDQQDTYILYEKQTHRQRQWFSRFNVLFRWGFAVMALAFWCAAIGYMGYTHLNA